MINNRPSMAQIFAPSLEFLHYSLEMNINYAKNATRDMYHPDALAWMRAFQAAKDALPPLPEK